MPELKDIIKTYGQIAPLTSFKRPMFIGPHPDDIEFGCGGLASKMKENDISVTYLIVTDGAAGGSLPASKMKKLREEESIEAGKYLGVENVEFCELEDGGPYSIDDAIKAIVPFVLKHQPDIVFAPDSRLRTECHPDHIKTGEAVRQLLKLVPYPESLRRRGIDIEGINAFPSDITLALYFSDDSNIREEISMKNLEDKINALMCHRSQMEDESTGLLLNYFRLKAQALGSQSSTGLAEDYQVIVPLCQHVYAEGIHYNEW